MKKSFLILGWGILFAVLLVNRLVEPMSGGMVIVLCLMGAIFLVTGTLMHKNKSQQNLCEINKSKT